MNRKPFLLALALPLVFAACSDDDANTRDVEEQTAEQQLDGYLRAQPVPVFNWSQLRQNLIEIQTAQANATTTTSFFFNHGIPDPIMSCPSIGFPIPATYQLTNPDNVVLPGSNSARGSVTVAQIESTGVYTGDTSGTYAICIDDQGRGFAFYWEGFVSTVSGPATWDEETRRVVMTGSPSANFTTEGGE